MFIYVNKYCYLSFRHTHAHTTSHTHTHHTHTHTHTHTTPHTLTLTEFLELDSVPLLPQVYLALYNHNQGSVVLSLAAQLLKALLYDPGIYCILENICRDLILLFAGLLAVIIMHSQ